jgi:hypothetical protein
MRLAPVKVAAPRKMTSAPPAVLKTAKPAPVPVPPLAPLGRRERSQLSRGRKDIDARIDLHGMTQTRAHHALSAFLHRASHDGMTFVLVITGKGRTTGPESERGILRRQVPLWLGTAGVSFAGGWIRGSAYRARRRRCAVCADQAGAFLTSPRQERAPQRGSERWRGDASFVKTTK